MLERGALRSAQRLQQEQLRASTLRLVAAGEAERRRLERDLHDGAQQRLLALGLGLARARAGAPEHGATLGEAARRVDALNDELRGVAHGIHSVTLAEGGLAEAVLALVDASGGGVAVDALPQERGTPEAEAAVYRLVAASLRLATQAGVRLALRSEAGELRAAIEVPGAQLEDALAHAGARVEALGGEITVDGGTVQARVPARR